MLQIQLSHLWLYHLALFILHFQDVLLQMMSGSLFSCPLFSDFGCAYRSKDLFNSEWDFISMYVSLSFLILRMGLLIIGEHIQYMLLLCLLLCQTVMTFDYHLFGSIKIGQFDYFRYKVVMFAEFYQIGFMLHCRILEL